jgi:hypothetical protein
MMNLSASNTSTYLIIPSIALHQSRHSFTCIFSRESFEAETNLQEERTHFRLLVKVYIINLGRLIFGKINISEEDFKAMDVMVGMWYKPSTVKKG